MFKFQADVELREAITFKAKGLASKAKAFNGK